MPPLRVWTLVALAALCASLAAPSERGTSDDLDDLYADLLQLRRIEVVNGLPDTTGAAMDAKREALKDLRARLQEMAVASWQRDQQVDYLVVRSVLDQYEFQHQVSRPWSRDPGFYVDPLLRLTFTVLPVHGDNLERLRTELRAVSRRLEQARANLTETARDYARLAIRNLEQADGVGHGHPYREVPPAGVMGWYEDFMERARRLQPDLETDIAEAAFAVSDFHRWLKEGLASMTAQAGVGRANFDWYLKHVKLMPYTADELLVLGDREYDRLIAALTLERHRNRRLPEIEPSRSADEYAARIAETDARVRRFIVERQMLTIPTYVGEFDHNVPWIVRPGGRNFWEEIQFRDPYPDHLHAVIPGHRFDTLMASHDDRPIRGNYSDGGRVEGWGTYLEEAFMNAGLLDDRPRTRELIYIFGIKRAVRIRADIDMQRNEMSVEEATQYMVERVPYLDDNVSRVDAEIYIRRPPAYGLSYMIGKLQIDELLADWARQRGDDFALGEFHDDFLASGRIPIALIRWEMTGLDDQVRDFWDTGPIPAPRPRPR